MDDNKCIESSLLHHKWYPVLFTKTVRIHTFVTDNIYDYMLAYTHTRTRTHIHTHLNIRITGIVWHYVATILLIS